MPLKKLTLIHKFCEAEIQTFKQTAVIRQSNILS